MKLCNQCGSEFSDRIDFCFYDGAQLDVSAGPGAGPDDAFDLPTPGGLPGASVQDDSFQFRPALAPIQMPARKVLKTAPPPPMAPSGPQAPAATPTAAAVAGPPESSVTLPPPEPLHHTRMELTDPAPRRSPEPEPETTDTTTAAGIPLWIWVAGGATAAVLLVGMAGFAMASLGYLGATIQHQVSVEPAPSPSVDPPTVVDTTDPDRFPSDPIQLGVQGSADVSETDDTDPSDTDSDGLDAGTSDTDTLDGSDSLDAGSDSLDAGSDSLDAGSDSLDAGSDSLDSDAPAGTPDDTEPNGGSTHDPGTAGSVDPDSASTTPDVSTDPVQPQQTGGDEPTPPQEPSPWGEAPVENGGDNTGSNAGGAEAGADSADQPATPKSRSKVMVFLVGDATGLKLYVDGRLQIGQWPHSVYVTPGMHMFRVVNATGGSYEIGKSVQFAGTDVPQIKLGAP